MNAHRVLLSASLAAAVTALSLGASACGSSSGNGSGGSLASGVVASVAGDEISQAELDEVISQAKERLESQGQKIPAAGSQEYRAFQQNALAYLVQRAQFEQQAEKLEVVVTDEEVDERVARVLTQFFGGDRKKYEEALEKQGITDARGARRASRDAHLGEDLREGGRHGEGHRRRGQARITTPTLSSTRSRRRAGCATSS